MSVSFNLDKPADVNLTEAEGNAGLPCSVRSETFSETTLTVSSNTRSSVSASRSRCHLTN